MRTRLPTFLPAALVPISCFFLANYCALGSWRPAYGEFGGPWYQFEGSHWKPDPNKKKLGIDWAREYESRATYAFHFLSIASIPARAALLCESLEEQSSVELKSITT